jgi:hypothetical protein
MTDMKKVHKLWEQLEADAAYGNPSSFPYPRSEELQFLVDKEWVMVIVMGYYEITVKGVEEYPRPSTMKYRFTLITGYCGALAMMGYKSRLEGLLIADGLKVDYYTTPVTRLDVGFLITTPHLERCLKVIAEEFEETEFHKLEVIQ